MSNKTGTGDWNSIEEYIKGTNEIMRVH